MPGFAYNPFAFSSKKPAGPTPPVLKAPFNPSRASAMVPPPGTPPAWLQPAQGPEIPDPTRPPPPPDPRLVPQAPQAGPPSPSPMGPPQPQRLGVPGDGGFDKLTQPPGMGDPFAGLDDEQMSQIMELGIMPEQLGEMDRQIAQFEGLRGRAMPEGRDSGRVYTAANPLEFLGAGMQAYGAHRKLEGGKAGLGGLLKEQQGLYGQREGRLQEGAAARKMFFDALRGKKKAALGMGQIGMPDETY